MSAAWGQIIMASAFLLIATALRIWAARKYVKVREHVENTELQEAWDALLGSSNAILMLLIMSLVWIANDALEKI